MEPPDDRASWKQGHVFIVRVWFERREIEGASPCWRAVIKHVATGRRRYMQDLHVIQSFIAPYLEEQAMEPAARRPLSRWLSHWRARRR